MSPPHLVTLSSIVLLYLLIGVQYAALTPRWQVPDEPAHYNYIREVAETGRLPVLDPGEYQQGYLGQLTSQGFPPELPIDSLKYESWQPPLYYLLAAPIYLVSNGDLLTLRLFSLALGAGVIVFTFLAVREAVPGRPHIALTAAGFVAFIPQHIAMMAGINNDSLSELLIAIGLWLILKVNNTSTLSGAERSEAQSKGVLVEKNASFDYAPFNTRELHPGAGKFRALRSGRLLWVLSVVIALALVTKSHAYLLVPVAGLMLILKWKQPTADSRQPSADSPQPSADSPQPSAISNPRSLISTYHLPLTQFTLLFFLPLLFACLWWGRNLLVYGWPDFMAAIRHDQVVSDQPRTADWVAQFGVPEVVRRFLQTTFQSFWGQFGWMGVPMPEKYYWGLGIFALAVSVGFVLVVIGKWRQKASSTITNQLPLTNYYLLLTSALLTFGLYFYYNLTYVQHQGRYLFPALVPLSLAVSLSLWWWGELCKRVMLRLAQRAEASLPVDKTAAETLRRPAPFRGFAAQSDILIPALSLLGLALLSLFALYHFILPSLA